MILTAALTGNLRETFRREGRLLSAALRAAVETTGKDLQGRLRAQAEGAQLRGGGRQMANAWRLKLYPAARARETFRPGGIIYSRMPKVVDAFETGARVTARGGKFLAIPTGYNRVAGRRQSRTERGGGQASGVRVTPAQMKAAKGQSFIIRSKKNPRVWLWCLRVRGTSVTGRTGRVRQSLSVLGNVPVATGRGTVAGQRAALGRATVLKQGFVPMFLLMREVQHRKRLDVANVRREAASVLAQNIAMEFSKLPPQAGGRD